MTEQKVALLPLSTGFRATGALALVPLLVLVQVLLAGCASRGQQAPSAPMLQASELQRGSALSAASANVSWPAEQWWLALHDEQLNRLVATALSDSPVLRASVARVRQAQALAGVARAATEPQVSAAASADRELYSAHSTVPAPLAGNYVSKYSATLTASYDLDLWGRQRAALAAALGERQLLAAEAQMARLTLTSAIVRSYIQLSLAYALQDHATQHLAQRQRMLDLTRQRQAVGLASEIDVASIATTLPAGRREQEQIATTIALLRNQLAVLIAKGPGDGEAIARPMLRLDEAAQRAAVPATLPAELVGHRPDIAAQRWRVEAARARSAGASAAFYPNINLAAFVGWQSLGLSHFLDSQSAVRGVAPAISLPLFDGGRLRSELESQNAALDAAIEQYNASVLQAMAEVANAVVQIASDTQQEQLAQAALVSARRQQVLAELAYRAGLTDAYNVLNAQLTLLNEEQQMAQVASKQLDHYTLLMTALGGGIKLE